MEVIKRGKTPDGVDIQIEDWNGRFDIGAYPIAKNAKKPWIDSGERFRLTLSGFNEDEAKWVFDKLVSGEMTLADLNGYFWNHTEDRWVLGLISYDEYTKYLVRNRRINRTYEYFEMLIADTKSDEERRELFQNAKKYVSGYVYGQYENISTKEQDEIIKQVCDIINIIYNTGY